MKDPGEWFILIGKLALSLFIQGKRTLNILLKKGDN